ncbi:enoyl-CoA hydratase/isomerase family protein [Frigidibacter sp. ROC022]|uniref:enoyl-CoA hydratase/isomerase family protein n=1 Tax=Frigidibacter sp. ROC022 TaxID=2971796 RepID=UPI00215A7C6D|nr:enoyl-CoA hydratase/isomerase family protein [Frigidibacter sp. ROC022]MCR8724941.1 enoyl-CoA hydratase/isomerase family protein [Frigidibacter sp. ROC022]
MIRIEDEGALRRITIARPDKANSLTGTMLGRLAQSVEDWSGSALVLSGEGRVFSAGADLDEVQAGTLATHPGWERLSGAIAAFPGLSVAALNGTAAGGALGMILACDLRLAVPGAAIFYPVMKMGVLPQPSDPARLAALVGPSRAALLLMAGVRVEAAEALAWGLIDRIVEPEALDETAVALCAPSLKAGATRVAEIRSMIRD